MTNASFTFGRSDRLGWHIFRSIFIPEFTSENDEALSFSRLRAFCRLYKAELVLPYPLDLRAPQCMRGARLWHRCLWRARPRPLRFFDDTSERPSYDESSTK